MPQTTLTDKTVQNLRAPTAGQVDYWDKHLSCFGLRIGVSGVKSWIVTTRKLENGAWTSPRRFTIGRYPALSLSDARKRAQEAIRLAAEGKDPGSVVKAARARMLDESRNSFSLIADDFLDRYVKRQNLAEGTAEQYRRALKGDAVKDWQSRPITTITKRDVLDLLDKFMDDGSPYAANRTLAYLRRFFAWCVERDILTVQPTNGIRPPAAEVSRDRFLIDSEIAEVWAVFDADTWPFGPYFKILLLTGQRRDEVAGMRWTEIKDLDGAEPLWELPGERTKNGLPHVVPLTPAVVALLKLAQKERFKGCPYVFSTNGKTYISGIGNAKERIDKAIAAAREKADVEPIAYWRPHDLRRTLVTGMAEMGVAPHIVEAVVNHISGTRAGVAGVYNRSVLLADRRKALEAWASHIFATISDKNSVASDQKSVAPAARTLAVAAQ